MLFRFFSHWRKSYSGIPLRIWFLALVTLVNRCGAMVISFISIYMTQHLGYDIKDTGYALGCFGAGAIVGAYAGGRLTDRIGYWLVQYWSLILNGIMLFLIMFVRDFWPMCGTIFLMSAISEAFRPAMSISINQNATEETITRSISLYRMAANLGWTVAPALGGILAYFGWHWLFVVDGATCILAALVLQRLLPRRLAQVKAKVAPETDDQSPKLPQPSPLRDKIFMAFIALTFLNAIVFMQIIWTIPVFFREVYKWPENQIGMVIALNGLIVFLVEMPLVFRLEGRHAVLSLVRVGLLCYALAHFAFLMPVFPMVAALAYIVAISIGEIFVMPFSSNFVYSRMGEAKQGQYVALYTIAYSVANIVAPLAGTQIIAAWGYHTLWTCAGVIALIVFVGVGLLEKKRSLVARPALDL